MLEQKSFSVDQQRCYFLFAFCVLSISVVDGNDIQ